MTAESRWRVVHWQVGWGYDSEVEEGCDDEVGRSFADLMVLCSSYKDYINVDLTGFGYRPIHYASAYNNIAAVKYLIEKGAAVDKANAWGYQPLHLCVPKGYYSVAKLLVEKGGSSVVNAQNCYGATALHYAADTGREDIVDLLLSNQSSRKI